MVQIHQQEQSVPPCPFRLGVALSVKKDHVSRGARRVIGRVLLYIQQLVFFNVFFRQRLSHTRLSWLLGTPASKYSVYDRKSLLLCLPEETSGCVFMYYSYPYDSYLWLLSVGKSEDLFAQVLCHAPHPLVGTQLSRSV